MNLTIFKFALIRGLRTPASLIINCVVPFALIFIRGLWEADYPIGFFFMGMMLMYGSFVAARGILNDKIDGVIYRILAGPVTTFGYLAQNLMACLIPLVAQISAILIIGSFLYSWKSAFVFPLALLYVMFAAASAAFSFAWSCVFKNREISYAVFSVVMSLVAMVGGFWIPLNILPNGLKIIGAFFPAYWTTSGITELMNDGAGLRYWLSVLMITVFTAVYLLFGGKRRIV